MASRDPLSNPTPDGDENAYPEDPAVQRPMDGTAIKEIVAKHPRAHAPAPTLRDSKGRIVPGSGRKQSK
jgi:hypothetical protein